MKLRDSEPRGAMLLTALGALGLHLLSLPDVLVILFRPAFVVLCVVYWSLNAPRAGGIALAFLTGLALESQGRGARPACARHPLIAYLDDPLAPDDARQAA